MTAIVNFQKIDQSFRSTPAFAGACDELERLAVVFFDDAFGLLDDFFAGVFLLFNYKSYNDKEKSYREIPTIFSIFIGSILGFISGVVGIGGGIFLSPILFLIRAGKPNHIVTIASLFILINSISGIIGQLTKNAVLIEVSNYWYLLVAVLIGGQIGNFFNLKIFSTQILALVTAFLVLFVAIRMGIRLVGIF